jgi:HEAT repeat protein
MGWPLPQDYNEAVQSPQTSFSDPELKSGEAVTNHLGIPLPRSGNFADVYEVRCPGGGRWAVKCFTREVPGLRERYAEISRYLEQAQLPFTVDFTFLEKGIRVRSQWYPVLKMRWVEGLSLNEFVRQYADKPAMLEALFQIWVRMAVRLRGAGIAHGDLQHGNLVLVPSGAKSLAVKLIDYDGMYVPALAARPSGEVGHPCYQHPQRAREGTYGPEMDRFPLLLVAAALSCVKVGGKALWEKYDTADNLLFREADLQAPVKSPLFYELIKLTDPLARRLVDHVLEALRGRLESAPLLDKVLPADHPAFASVPPPSAPPARTGLRMDPTKAATKAPARRGTGRHRAAWAVGSAMLLLLVLGPLLSFLLSDSTPPAGSEGGKAGPVAQKKDRQPAPDEENVPPKKDQSQKEPQKPRDEPLAKEPEKPTDKPPETPPALPPGENPKKAADKLPADASVAVLRKALKDEDPAVQELAAARLANLGPAAAPAVVALARALEDSKVLAVRRNAAIALSKIGKEAKPAVPALASVLGLGEPAEVRRGAAEALALIKLPHTEEAIPALLESIEKDPDSLVRQRCVWALFEFWTLGEAGRKNFLTKAKPILSSVLDEKGKEFTLVRYDAARMLANGWKADAPDRTVEVLLEMLTNKALRVFNKSDVKVDPAGSGRTSTAENLGGDARFMAAQALGWLGKTASARRDVVDSLKAAAMDKDVQLQEAAKASLKTLGVP